MSALVASELVCVDAAGGLVVDIPGAGRQLVAWLESHGNSGLVLKVGDRLLVALGDGDCPSVALGRIGRYDVQRPGTNVTIEATESLTLKCGEASIDLRADGKVMVRGEDVLLRAKGTQRIRGGTVSIN